MSKWKTVSFILLVILIPLCVNLISNYTTWFTTREKVELTLKLDGWIQIGSLKEGALENLSLLYENKPINNVLKVSWKIFNTGSRGIDKFEIPPTIIYPHDVKILTAKIADKSPLLILGEHVVIDQESRTIQANDIGIFNSGDFFKVDVYIRDVTSPVSSYEHFKDWDYRAKSLDIKLEKEISSEAGTDQQKILVGPLIETTIAIYTVLVALFFVTYLNQTIKRKLYSNKSITKLLGEAICYNQGALSQYAFSASEKHKLIKDEMRMETPDKVKLLGYVNDLSNYIDFEMEKVFKDNFKFLISYFGDRSNNAPRVCIKSSHESKHGEKLIIDLFRNRKRLYKVDYPIESNTGFYETYKSGKYYINNNIPMDAKTGRYENPRIRKDKAIAYKYQIWDKLKTIIIKNDTQWMECWHPIQIEEGGAGIQPPPETCYKATLIIPMTLLGNQLSEAFKKHFNISSLSNESRSIYGFLCFDHTSMNYFNEVDDVRVGYIFADIMSLYLISGLTYTKYSATFRKATKLLKDS